MEDKAKDKNKGYSEAYEADKKMRAVREEELQAAKDYLGVLLDEIETKNKELEAAKMEIQGLRGNAEVTGSSTAALEEVVKKKSRSAVFWMVMSLFEAAVAVVLLVVMLRNLGTDQQTVNLVEPTPAVTAGAAVDDEGDAINGQKTERFYDNLAELADAFNGTGDSEFSAEVINKNNFEYLSFINGDIRVSYRNEYESGDDLFKKSIIIENSIKRVELVHSYDFADGASSLCPQTIDISGKGRTLVLISGVSEATGGMPSEIRFVDESTLTEYPLYGFAEDLKKLIKLEYLTERSPLTEAPVRFTVMLEGSERMYDYALPESVYTDLVYNDGSEMRLSQGFRMELVEDGIYFEVLATLSDSLYLGVLSGKLTVSGGEVSFINVRFAAFAGADQEDADKQGLIIPMTELPEQYVRIGGRTGLTYLIPVNKNVEPMPYSLDNLVTDDANNWLYHDEDGAVSSVKGIDVSKYQGDIDWKRVKDDGVEFAIIRLGFRGMNEGTLEIDPYFEQNINGALDAGVRVGVYFFSQAITEEEAREEAEFVLELIEKYEITYPVAFDTEYIPPTTIDARANGLSRSQRTDMCIAFCERIREAGYIPMIYSNTKYMIMGIDLERLAAYDKWFAYYGSGITFPYSFDILQYTDTGRVDGIDGAVDINISFKKY